WLPIRHALLYAAPNKFFQAVAAGVPVISAPHPQTKMLIERYGCGLILKGWEKTHLIAGLKEATKLIGSSEFSEMIKNCEIAVKTELSWDRQMQKLIKLLDAEF